LAAFSSPLSPFGPCFQSQNFVVSDENSAELIKNSAEINIKAPKDF
jgi:hypothetical protein